MKCEDIQEQLVAFSSGEFTPIESEYIQKHIESCEECSRALEELKIVIGAMEKMPVFHPSKNLAANFDQMLKMEQNLLETKSPEAKIKPIRSFRNFSLIQIAASVTILAIGIWIGMQLQTRKSNGEIATFQKELMKTKQLVMLSMLEKSSASERIKAVHSVSELIEPSPQMTEALIQTLHYDNNVNVRLAAISALSRFSSNETVRKATIQALSSQKDPIVQIALINLLVSWEEKDATKVLEKLLKDQETLDVVKDQAEKGLQILM